MKPYGDSHFSPFLAAILIAVPAVPMASSTDYLANAIALMPTDERDAFRKALAWYTPRAASSGVSDPLIRDRNIVSRFASRELASLVRSLYTDEHARLTALVG